MKEKMNLLFIFTDEQSADTMKAYGNNVIKTPNLNKLSDESLVFKNTYVTQPVCTPSRCSIMTGLYPHTTGCTENNIPMRLKTPAMPELGKFDDYQKAYIGKWHLGDEVFNQHGFDKWVSTEDHYRKYYRKERDMMQRSAYSQFLLDLGYEPDVICEDGFKYSSKEKTMEYPEEHSRPAFIASESSKFIEENKDNPFMLYINFYEPHFPFYGVFDNLHAPEDVVLPENFLAENEDVHLRTRLIRRGFKEYEETSIPDFFTKDELKCELDWRKMIAKYWGNVSLVDKYLGKILKTLEDCGLKENTIVVFTSDHGDMVGSHGLIAKGVMYSEAVKVPYLMRVPYMQSDVIENNISQIDLVPTLLDALGQEIPSHLEGYSLMPFITKKEDKPREENVFIEWNGHHVGVLPDELNNVPMLDCWSELADKETIVKAITDPVRTIVTKDNWKYNYSMEFRDELYNLNDDPYEMVNLAGREEYEEKVKELKKLIFEWKKRTKDN